MSRVAVVSEVDIYEINGDEVPVGTHRALKVSSHWNDSERAVLRFGRISFTILIDDLLVALKNAGNTA